LVFMYLDTESFILATMGTILLVAVLFFPCVLSYAKQGTLLKYYIHPTDIPTKAIIDNENVKRNVDPNITSLVGNLLHQHSFRFYRHHLII